MIDKLKTFFKNVKILVKQTSVGQICLNITVKMRK